MKVIEQQLGVTGAELRSPSKKTPHTTARVVFIALISRAIDFRAEVAAHFLGRKVRDINHLRSNHRAWIVVDQAYQESYNRCLVAYSENGFDLVDMIDEVQARIHRDTELLLAIQEKLKRLRNE
jgi:hypothetical protein